MLMAASTLGSLLVIQDIQYPHADLAVGDCPADEKFQLIVARVTLSAQVSIYSMWLDSPIHVLSTPIRDGP